jgi:sialate O-acetylesterase
MNPRACALLTLLLLSVWTAFAKSTPGPAAGHGPDVKLADPFGDDMILQQGMVVPVWGEATPGITVTVLFAGQSKTTTADANGNWEVKLDPLTASSIIGN